MGKAATTIEEKAKTVVSSAGDAIKETVSDPGKALTAVATGGASVQYDTYNKAVTRSLAADTSMPTPDSPSASPSADAPDAQASMDEAAGKQRRARGRASTILGGKSYGLDSGGSASRRTLLGD